MVASKATTTTSILSIYQSKAIIFADMETYQSIIRNVIIMQVIFILAHTIT
jgi:hypothetical protein